MVSNLEPRIPAMELTEIERLRLACEEVLELIRCDADGVRHERRR
jgi:hypothetical protein